jgi:hypothetical protein
LAGAVLLTLFAAELLYFHLVLTSTAPNGKAEAVIVFNGSAERVGPGHQAAADRGARYLVFSPAPALTIETYGKRYSRTGYDYLLEDKARTTFENAYYANEIISGHHMESVIYEEMVKLWGSLGEMVLYKIRGKLPERNPKTSPVIRKLKSWMLFRV